MDVSPGPSHPRSRRSAPTSDAAPARICFLENELALQRDRLDALLRLVEATSDAILSRETFDDIADALLRITGVDTLTLALRGTDGVYHNVVNIGLLPEFLSELEAKDMAVDGGTFIKELERSGRPISFVNYQDDPRALPEHKGRTDSKGVAFIPLLASGQLLGCIALGSREEVHWDEGELAWLALVGRECGILVRHAQLAEDLKEAEVLRERERLGRELRDGIAQALGYQVRKFQHPHRPPQAVPQPPGEEPAHLTSREKDILALIAGGATNQEIALRLFITENTVKKHLQSILTKLHFQNRVQAAVYAVREGLLPDEFGRDE